MPKRSMCRIVGAVFVLVLVFSTAGFAFESADDQLVIPDLLIGKPLGLIGLGLGALTYVVTLPITLPLGWQKTASEAMVKKPYRWTFQRGLGEELTTY